MSIDPGCSCNEVRATLDELQRTVEMWARLESPDPHHIDRLTDDATQRIRFAALAASATTRDER